MIFTMIKELAEKWTKKENKPSYPPYSFNTPNEGGANQAIQEI